MLSCTLCNSLYCLSVYWAQHILLLQAMKLSPGVAKQLQTFPCMRCVQDGWGTANTALIYHANKLLALHEADLPYAVSSSLLSAFC